MAARKYDYTTYVHGSTAQEIEPADTHEKERGTRERRDKRKSPAHRARVVEWDIPSLFFMIAAIGVTMYICVSYVQVQHEITTMSKQVARMESEILELKNKNDADYDAVDMSVDLSKIYKTAVHDFGMVPLKKDQVILYHPIKSDIVRQYGEVPEEEGNLLDKIIENYKTK